jgi:hypothetical protein
MRPLKQPTERVYEILTGDDEGRVCRDIPEESCKEQPRNFLTHVGSLALTKTGDGFADPKLVLAWLLGALGAPAAATGMLVPVREALALLPQLVTAGTIRSLQKRKWVWVFGSFVQGACVFGMALVALTLEGASAGWSIVGLLALFALGRSLCSVSYKDVLGKTVSKGHRGTATGTASSIASAAVLALGAAFSSGLIDLSVQLVAALLAIAGGLWFAAAALFSTLPELPGATEGGGDAWKVARDQASLLRDDPQLTRFIATRGLLTGTALAPPFLLAVAGSQQSQGPDTLGAFLLASALSGTVSTYFWGRLADRSSRQVLVLSGLAAAIIFASVAGAGLIDGALVKHPYVIAGALFFLMIAYKGVRLGRSTHIVDMAPAEKRAAYTALSNTVVGLLLIVGGVFGAIADLFGNIAVIAIFALMSLVAAVVGMGLDEVQ